MRLLQGSGQATVSITVTRPIGGSMDDMYDSNARHSPSLLSNRCWCVQHELLPVHRLCMHIEAS